MVSLLLKFVLFIVEILSIIRFAVKPRIALLPNAACKITYRVDFKGKSGAFRVEASAALWSP